LSLGDFTGAEDNSDREQLDVTFIGKYKGYGIFLHPLYGYQITRMDEPNLINVGIHIHDIEVAHIFIDELPEPPSFYDKLLSKPNRD